MRLKPPRTPRYYLIFVSSMQARLHSEEPDGWWGIRCEDTGNQWLVSRSKREAQAELDELRKPELRLPYKKTLSDLIDDAEPKERKARSASVEPKAPRAYHSVVSRLEDPAILALFANLECRGGRYYKNNEQFFILKKLCALTGKQDEKASSRFIRAAWKRGLIRGEQPIRKRREIAALPG
jgi:hypothetical protein